MSIIYLNKDNFDQEVLKSKIPVLVDFYADWCGPCKRIAPVIDELAGEYKGEVKVCKINVDQEAEVAGNYSVMSIPTIIFFKAGANVKQIVGGVSKDKIVEAINQL